MSARAGTRGEHRGEIDELRRRLDEAEDTLAAIRSGAVDALVVSGPDGDHVFHLRDADRPYRVMVEEMHQATVSATFEGLICYCNHRLVELLREPRRGLIGTHLGAFVAPQTRHAFDALLEGGRSGRCEGEVILKAHDGTEIPAYVSVSPLSLDGSTNLCVMITDLTEQKRHEAMESAEMKRRAEQLRRLASELTLAEQRERRRLAQVLHDQLQQLLFAARLTLGAVRARLDEDVTKIIRQVDDLLGQAIDESRSLCSELSPRLLYEAGLAPALESLARKMHEKFGMTIEVEAGPDTDPRSEDISVVLFQSVRELLFNVVKHGKTKQARVQMVRSSDDFLRILVADEGAGFDPSALENADSGATGFGLFHIRERLELMGGSLTIDSAPGQGARMTIVAPHRLAAESAGADGEAAPAPVVSCRLDQVCCVGAAGNRPIRVLLADDHRVVLDGLVSLMQEQSDIQVVGEASNGLEAVDLALKTRPDVVVMDISMPGLNGIETTRRILAQLPDTRVIGLSMHEEPRMAEAMRAEGAAGYLPKGTHAETLLIAIRAACPTAQASSPVAE